eukprot:TRINITY_DN336_c0_g1_i1.p1 TRINITY_DN336_c0_g1~~TRINITY_DN336_c0_g1_i1.p1  ORF type:complete len:285 (+),score=39.88 TRINITY_DN336_c0_g1_i1:86-856(+)
MALSLCLVLFSLCFYAHAQENEVPEIIFGHAEADAAPQPAKVTTLQDSATSLHLAGLNHMTFSGNVLKEKDNMAETWVVSFCPPWWEPCQELEPVFAQMARSWQGRLNKDDLSLKVRFATVDCAVDKVLCNEQKVLNYPTVSVYQGGKQKWRTSPYGATMQSKLDAFLSKHLTPVEPSGDDLALGSSKLLSQLRHYSVDLALLVAAFGASLHLVSGNPDLWQKRPSAAPDGNAATGRTAAANLPEEWTQARRPLEL